MKLVVGVALLSLGVVGCTGLPGPIDHGGPGPFGGGIDMGMGFPFPTGPQPQFGPTVTAATPPPPLSGGTLVMLADGKTAFAADPDRDQAYVIDLAAPALKSTIALSAGDEPGRAVEDGAGKVHLALRRGGAVVTIDPATGAVVDRTAVCAAPRGIAYETATDLVHVACAGGEVVSLPAAGGAAVRTFTLQRDLRDILVVNGQLWISIFRTAEILVVNTDGTVAQRIQLPHGFSFTGGDASPSVAWRMMKLPDGNVGVVHQLGVTGPVQTTQGGYGGGGVGGGGGCGGIVEGAFTVVDPATFAVSSSAVGGAVLPVDFAPMTHGGVAMLASGNAHTPGLGQLLQLPEPQVVVPSNPDMGDGGGGGCTDQMGLPLPGEAIALGSDGTGNLWVQTREPAALERVSSSGNVDATVSLSTDSRADTAWAVFHSNSGASVACASCHPEGGEDGRVWLFDALGPRRTQSLRGHVGGTEPFHWGGDLMDFDALVGEVYLRRMAGPMLAPDQKDALFAWINAIPLLPQSPPADPAAVARGKALFEDTTHAACSTCHSGPELTNNSTVDVGTGGGFQVPRLLGVAWRAPFLHDGCAKTLTDRFTSCGGTTDQHGVTSGLTAAQISDLVAYLSTL